MTIHDIYQWLMMTNPKTIDENRQWKDLAETFIIHASIPLTSITGKQKLDITKKAKSLNINLVDHIQILYGN